MNYHSILGLTEGATEQEIKKAYFRLIREYSPETHPKEFQKIRQAYENLKENHIEEKPQFETPTDKVELLFRKQIDKLMGSQQYEECRDTCEEAVYRFPDNIHFLYDLSIAQRLCGNTAKAAKTAEKLVERQPENKWFREALALAYIGRGYVKKAVLEIEKAYELGCRSDDFLLTSARIVYEKGKNVLAEKMLLDYLQKKKQWKREEIPQCMDVFMGLMVINKDNYKELKCSAERFVEFLKIHAAYFNEESEALYGISMINGVLSMDESEEGRSISRYVREALKTYCPTQEIQDEIAYMENQMVVSKLLEDTRLHEDTKKLGAIYFYGDDMDETDARFALLDTKLCLIKERNSFLEDMKIIHQDYPAVSEWMQEFADKIKSEKDVFNLKASLQRQYTAMAEYCEPALYFERYPEEKEKSLGKILYDNKEQIPYVREEKIGRNSLCPCGSGKKYKKCCGK